MSRVRDFFMAKGLDKERLEKVLILGEHIKNLPAKNVVVKAPTGFGKSMLGFVIAESYAMENTKTIGLTPYKALQDQYEETIKEYGFKARILKGGNNYPCLKDSNKTWETRPCKGASITKLMSDDNKVCDKSKDCPYIRARSAAIKSNYCIFNNQYLNTIMKSEKAYEPFLDRKILIVDEAHSFAKNLRESSKASFNLQKMITNLVAMAISRDDVECDDKVGVRLRDLYDLYVETFNMIADNEWRSNINSICDNLNEMAKFKVPEIDSFNFKVVLPSDYEEFGEDEQKSMRESASIIADMTKASVSESLNEFTEVLESIQWALKSVKTPSNLVCDTNNSNIEIYMYDLSDVYRKNFSRYDKVIFMSATPHNSILSELGITGDFIDVQSDFDTTKCLSYFLTDKMSDMSYKNRDKNYKKLFSNTIKVIEKLKTKNGLIQSGSYLFQSKFQKYLEKYYGDDFVSKFIFCKSSEDIDRGLKMMKDENNKKGLILVSPAITEGFDGYGDIARFNIVFCCPRPSIASRLNRQILNTNPTLYKEMTAQTLEQMVGRGQRHKNDYCYTFFMDKNIYNFVYNNKNLFSDLFKKKLTIR